MIRNKPLPPHWLIELTGCCGYPAAFACAALAGWMALEVGVGLWPAAYVAAATGITTVVLLEFFAPYRAGWRPRADSVRLDLVYLMVVQIALPLAIQVGLVLLLAELPRYGLHRFLHRGRRLWRFHALHHAPAQLYALNVGRFHRSSGCGLMPTTSGEMSRRPAVLSGP